MKIIGSSRKFTQVYKSLHSTNPYNIGLSICRLDIINSILDSMNHWDSDPKHLISESTNSKVRSSFQLWFLLVEPFQFAYQMCISGSREVIIFDNAIEVQYQSIDMSIHEWSHFLGSCFGYFMWFRFQFIHHHLCVDTRCQRFISVVWFCRKHLSCRVIERFQNRCNFRSLT